jgi:hypothetical protein
MTILRGISYPLQAFNGSLKLSEDPELVQEHIYSVLETRPGERIMRQEYGCPDFIFDSVQETATIPIRLQIALDEQVAEPEAWKVGGAIAESGDFLITVQYTLNQFEWAINLKLTR